MTLSSFSPSSPLPMAAPRVHPRWWQWPGVLSLEAPAVAVSWQLLLAGVFGTVLRPAHVALLASAVWLAYVADRWMDALVPRSDSRKQEKVERGTARALEVRHHFLAERPRWVALLWGVVLVAALGLAAHDLDSRELGCGLVLTAGVAAYLAAVHLGWSFGKPLQIGLLFALGVGLFSLGSTPWERSLPALSCFGALCWLNCALIAHWEASESETAVGGTSLVASGVGLAVAGTALAAGGEGLIGIAVGLSALGLLSVHRCRERLSTEWLHVLADAVLLVPLPLLVLSRFWLFGL